MKKLISLVCMVVFIATSIVSVSVQAEANVDKVSNSVSYDFEGFEGNADYSISSLTKYGGTWSSMDFAANVVGVTDIKTDRGTSVNLIHKGGQEDHQYAFIRAYPANEIKTSFNFKVSIYLEDTSRPRAIRIANRVVVILFNGSSISLMGNSVKMKATSGKWYDISLKLNLQTGYYLADLTCDNITESFEGINTSAVSYGKVDYMELGYYGKNSKDIVNNTWYDDISIAQTEPLYKSFSSENDFDFFVDSSDGTTVPEGFNASGVSENVNGFYAENGGVKIVTGNQTPLILEKPIAISGEINATAYGIIRAMLDFRLSDKNAERSFMVGDNEVLKFTSDGNIVSADKSAEYETGKDYKISIQINAKTNSVTAIVNDGDTQIISYTSTVTFENNNISALLKTTQTGDSSEAYIDNFNVYNDNGLLMTESIPASGSKKIKPCDVKVYFSNPIDSVDYASLNGKSVDYYVTSKYEVTVDTASLMKYGEDYTLSLGNVKDIFGEKKDYSIVFSTIDAQSVSDISITSGNNVTASVSGISNDGNAYSYSLVLAKFSAENNSLTDIDKTDFTLDDSQNNYTVSLVNDENSYYEAYLWDSMDSMKAVCTKATFGTEPFSDAEPGTDGFHEDMDSGVMIGTNLGINSQGMSTLIVFKPGKNIDDIATANELIDVIDFIKQFDNKSKDVFAFTPSGGNGTYSYILDGKYTSNAFNYIEPIYVQSVYEKINEDNIKFIDCIEAYNDVLCCDTTELNKFDDSEKSKIEQLMLASREERENGFDTIASFQNAFYNAVALVLIENSTQSSDVKAAIEKYGSALGVKNFTAYKTFTESNDTAKAEVYAAIANAKKTDKNSFDKIDVLFSNNAVLAGVRNSQRQVQIGNILTDNNDTILHFDFSSYNKITNKSALHTKLIGIQVKSFNEFNAAFNAAVQKRLEEESSEEDISSGVSVAGNTVTYDFEGYVGNDETLSISSLTNWKSGWSSYGLGEGLAGPTSVKTDRGTSVNLVNRGAAEQYPNAVIRPNAKADISTCAEIKVSMQFKELNRPRALYIYGGGKQLNSCLIQGSRITLLGNVLDMKAEADKWYDFTIRINKVSGYYEASVSCDGNVEKVSGVNATIMDFSVIGYLGLGYVGNRTSGNVTNTWYDDITIKEIDPIYIPYVSQCDFDSFEEGTGGTAVPQGFKATGVEKGVNGFFSENGNLVIKTAQEGDITLTKEYEFTGGFQTPVFGTIRTDAEINLADNAADRIIKIGDNEVARFGADGYLTVGEATSAYKINKDYKITIKADPKKLTDDRGETYYNLVTVSLSDDNGEIFNATNKIPDGSITGTTLTVSQKGSSSKTSLKSFNTYNDNGFYLADSTPSAYETGVVPCDAEFTFSNQITEVKSVTLNGTPVDFKFTANNKIKVEIESLLEYNTKYTINIYSVQDMFGEMKDFKLIFYTTFASKLYDISIEDGDNVTASVTGFSYDGNKYTYEFVLAKFDSAANKLLDAKKTNISLGASKKEFALYMEKTEGAYYEAYVWDSINGMVAVKDKATFGTSDLADTALGKDGYVQDMNNLVVTASNTGIAGNGRNTLLIFKPGKNISDISAASSICDVIDYIGQFDNAETDVYAYTPANGGGQYGVAINGVYKPNAFTYIDPEYIAEAFNEINKEDASLVDCIDKYNNVLEVETNDLDGFDDAEKARLEELLSEEREKLDNGFETTQSFKTAYNYAVSRVVIENAKNGKDIKLAFEKYGDGLGLSDFVAYGNFAKLSQSAKDMIYDDIASSNDLSTVEKIEDTFAKASILRAVQFSDNYVEISNIINENNDYLKFDVSIYNKLNKRSNVDKALIGNYYQTIEKFKNAFDDAVAKQKNSELVGTGSSGGFSGGGSSGGSYDNVVTFGPARSEETKEIFSDIANYPWAKESIEALASKGIISGRANGIFDPEASITRAEFTKIIVSAFIGADESLKCDFTDVEDSAWYYSYVATAQKFALINGISQSTFGTGDKITRQDMATILFRTAKQCGISLDSGSMIFTDSEYIDDYAKEAVTSLCASGIINGKDNNVFDPKSFATRAESAKMIYGLLKRGDKY